MGKIIKVKGLISTKIGHVIGAKGNKILCEEMDNDFNFICEDVTIKGSLTGHEVTIAGNRKVFACDPSKSEQIGYLDPIEELFKKKII